MSYIPFRDNPDLEGIPKRITPELEALADLIDESSARGNHHDDCGCDDPGCANLGRNLASHTAGTTETLGWLYAKGLLTLPRPGGVA